VRASRAFLCRGCAAFAWCVLAGACAAVPPTADPASDAPEGPRAAAPGYRAAPSYAEALRHWRTAEDVNAWIGARFEYDMARALRLSETQRSRGGRLPIHDPEAFYESPRGVCVDLARFGVETLRAIDPAAKPAYLMIEFAPVSVAGNTLRRHWVAAYQRDGRHYFFADSKRPGHIAGPYASTQAFVDDYARYRGREIVAHRERATYERQERRAARRQEHPAAP
jgi:hypothetical protein